ncbi:hypothetical protein D1J72_01170 [Streptococcus anginosus]|uniref:Uncharacterized protein n=1 Tax=Streptococcus anginosus SK1138 TaxID=1161422 RepID=A0AAD2T6R2_STRAP|nr:hypothetical protein [Streptococcus anginosus]EJP24733.1 hypothetical protein HMPREF1126_1540 [Streptococcus anginosus SK1138]RIB36615.1 hypothetical protein D1J72_01170 [Streptococcus anginosus]
MNITQEERLMSLLTDYVFLIDGDLVLGYHPEATNLTRSNLLQQMEEEYKTLITDDPTLRNWYHDNIDLLNQVKDTSFEQALKEKILLAELQTGHSIWQELTPKQVDRLGQKLVENEMIQSSSIDSKTVTKLKKIFPYLGKQ